MSSLDELTPSERRWRDECCAYLRAKCANDKEAEDYINEAEHMEGYTYWNYFATLEEVYADFLIYTTEP